MLVKNDSNSNLKYRQTTKVFKPWNQNVQGGSDKSCVNTTEKPNLDKMFKGSKLIKTVVKTIKQMPIEFIKC